MADQTKSNPAFLIIGAVIFIVAVFLIGNVVAYVPLRIPETPIILFVLNSFPLLSCFSFYPPRVPPRSARQQSSFSQNWKENEIISFYDTHNATRTTQRERRVESAPSSKS